MQTLLQRAPLPHFGCVEQQVLGKIQYLFNLDFINPGLAEVQFNRSQFVVQGSPHLLVVVTADCLLEHKSIVQLPFPSLQFVHLLFHPANESNGTCLLSLPNIQDHLTKEAQVSGIWLLLPKELDKTVFEVLPPNIDWRRAATVLAAIVSVLDVHLTAGPACRQRFVVMGAKDEVTKWEIRVIPLSGSDADAPSRKDLLNAAEYFNRHKGRLIA